MMRKEPAEHWQCKLEHVWKYTWVSAQILKPKQWETHNFLLLIEQKKQLKIVKVPKHKHKPNRSWILKLFPPQSSSPFHIQAFLPLSSNIRYFKYSFYSLIKTLKSAVTSTLMVKNISWTEKWQVWIENLKVDFSLKVQTLPLIRSQSNDSENKNTSGGLIPEKQTSSEPNRSGPVHSKPLDLLQQLVLLTLASPR